MQCVCLVRADGFPSVRARVRNIREGWKRGGGWRNRGMAEKRKSMRLLQGREDRDCDEREGEGKEGVERKREVRKAHLYAGYCVLLV